MCGGWERHRYLSQIISINLSWTLQWRGRRRAEVFEDVDWKKVVNF